MPTSDSSRRADYFAPNESSVAQMRAELWPETCSGRIRIQNVKDASILFSELWMIIRVCITGLLIARVVNLTNCAAEKYPPPPVTVF